MDAFTDQDRRAIVNDYLRSGLSQHRFLERLLRERGFRVSPRTLRSWLKRFGPKRDASAECRAIIETTIAKLQRLLVELDASESPPCHPEDDPATTPTTEAAQARVAEVAPPTQRPVGILPAATSQAPKPLPAPTNGAVWMLL